MYFTRLDSFGLVFPLKVIKVKCVIFLNKHLLFSFATNTIIFPNMLKFFQIYCCLFSFVVFYNLHFGFVHVFCISQPLQDEIP